MKRLWNFIRWDKSMYDDICVSDFHKYFSAKCCDSEYTNDVILEAERCVQEKYDDILNGELPFRPWVSGRLHSFPRYGPIQCSTA